MAEKFCWPDHNFPTEKGKRRKEQCLKDVVEQLSTVLTLSTLDLFWSISKRVCRINENIYEFRNCVIFIEISNTLWRKARNVYEFHSRGFVYSRTSRIVTNRNKSGAKIWRPNSSTCIKDRAFLEHDIFYVRCTFESRVICWTKLRGWGSDACAKIRQGKTGKRATMYYVWEERWMAPLSRPLYTSAHSRTMKIYMQTYISWHAGEF